MVEYTEIMRKQYFEELESRMKKLEKELEIGSNPVTALKMLITAEGLETARRLEIDSLTLENMEEPKIKPVYLKVNRFDPLFGHDSFEVMPTIRYDKVKAGREFYSKCQ